MKKINVSIIGSCVSRELFNDPRMQEIFNIDFYGFKICPWALFDKGCYVPTQWIKSAPNPGFINRMLDLEINKKTIQQLQTVKSEMLFVDFYAVIERIFKLTYKNNQTYIQTQNCSNYLNSFLNSLKNNNEFKVKEFCLSSIPKKLILQGLDKFAEFANSNYSKVILSWPKFSKQYLSFDGSIKEFKKDGGGNEKIIWEYTKYFESKLQNSLSLYWEKDWLARVYYDDFLYVNDAKFEPTQVHILDECFEKLVDKLLLDLKIDYKDFYIKNLDYNSFKYEKAQLELGKYRALVEKMKKSVLCNIISYTNFLNTLQHHLIVISVRDEASKLLSRYINRFCLGLKFDLKYRDSYIAIIDTKNNYRYEQSSQEELEFKYDIPNTKQSIFVKSCGFNAKSLSAIIYKNIERSKNRRGLNFFVLDLDNLQVVDCATCDTNADEFLLVDSDYFLTFNNKMGN